MSSSQEKTADNILSVLTQAVEDPKPDFEHVQHDGFIHVGLFVPDGDLNRDFQQKQGSETVPMSLEDASPCQIGIEHPGPFDSIYFGKLPPSQEMLKPGFIRIDVKSVGLNAKASDPATTGSETANNVRISNHLVARSTLKTLPAPWSIVV